MNKGVPPGCCEVDLAEEDSHLLTLELAFADAPTPRREGDEDDAGGGEVYRRRRCERANAGCGCVLFGRVESGIVAPLPLPQLSSLLLYEFLLSIDIPPKNTPWFAVEELVNADCAVEDIPFELDSSEDEYEPG